MNAQKGFTLIELMIVVAIIGILAAIAIPQYQNYIAKSQVSRVMSESGSLKTVVENCINEGRTETFYSNVAANTDVEPNECELGATASTLVSGAGNTPAVAAVTGTNGYPFVEYDAAAGTTITSVFGSSAAASVKGPSNDNELVWFRSNVGTWSCYTTVESKFRPNGCTDSSAP